MRELAVPAPVRPMLAKRVEALPDGDHWLYEPKWDGFRTLVFRNGDDLLLRSRDLKPMNRYFPELVRQLPAQLPQRCVVDGEVVIAGPDGLEFQSLQLRIHPAASRVALLAQDSPASFVAWDLLSVDDEDLTGVPFAARRARLEQVLGPARPPLHLTPITRNPVEARDWFTRFEGAGLDGVMAKDAAGAYQPGKRAMLKLKLKHRRTADCVVAGLRWHRGAPDERVGSLLLGLFDHQARLQHVGVAGAFSMARRRALVAELAPYRTGTAGHPWAAASGAATAERGAPPAGAAGVVAAPPHRVPAPRVPAPRVPGATSRWTGGKDLSWVPLRPELVVEVTYDHLEGSRLRHTAQFLRWRPDKAPAECTYAQLEVTPPFELACISPPAPGTAPPGAAPRAGRAPPDDPEPATRPVPAPPGTAAAAHRLWPIEVKWTSQVRSTDLKQARKYRNSLICSRIATADRIHGLPNELLALCSIWCATRSGSWRRWAASRCAR